MRSQKQVLLLAVCSVILTILSPVICTADVNAPFRHHLSLTLEPSEHQIRASDRLTFDRTPRKLRLWLHPDAVITLIRSGLDSLNYRFRQGQISIDLPPGLYDKPGEIRIDYRLTFPDALPPTAAHHEDPSYGISAAIGPAGAFLGGGSRWFPQMGRGQPTVELTLTLPADWEAVTDGQLLERRLSDGQRIVRYKTRLFRPGLAVAAGPWRFSEDRQGTIPIYAFFSESNQFLAPRYLEKSRLYLDEYVDLLGPYPFEKFAIGENFFPSGYGYASWTLLGRRVIRLPFILTSSLPHEIVHNWLGNGVLVDYGRGNWCEGLTTYLADYRVLEKRDAASALEYRLRILRDYAALVQPEQDYPVSAFQTRTSKVDQAIGYGKTMMIFHMLRQQIGEQAFWQGLKALVQQQMYRLTSWQDLQRVFERSSQKPLAAFFSQWVNRTGLPQLKLADVSVQPSNNQWRIQGRIEQTAPVYDLQIPLVLTTAEGQQRQRMTLNQQNGSFEFISDAPPDSLAVDPDTDLIRQLYPQEVPPTVNNLRASQNLLVVLSSDLSEEIHGQALNLLGGLRQSSATIVTETDLSADDLIGRDVLFIGRPKNGSWLPSQGKFTLSDQGFSLAETTYDQVDDALFTIQNHTQSADRIMALFWPRTAAQAQTVARKIPHYGKYSYLVFRQGTNTAKGTWPVESSPLIHHFPQKGDL